jgi:hypothetical protein
MRRTLIVAGAALLLIAGNSAVSAKTTEQGSTRSVGPTIDGGTVLAQRGARGGGAFRGGGGGAFRGGGGAAFRGGGGAVFRGGGAVFRGGGGRAFIRGGVGPRVAFRGPGRGGAFIRRGGFARYAVVPRRVFPGIRRPFVRRIAPFVVLGAATPYFYNYYGYGSPYYDDCSQVRLVWTNFGWRWARFYVCD